MSLREALDRGYTLPAEWYTDAAIFGVEKEKIFARSWQWAGLVEQVASPGEFFTYRAAGIPIVVVRDEDETIRAFINVCRHRGSELVLAESGCRKSLQCHYHAWTYNLDGTLRVARGADLEPDFDRAELSLLPVQVDTWGPLIFVNPDLSAPGLAQVLGELPGLVAGTGVGLGALRRRVTRSYDIAANWKVVVDNYLECYHCPVAHPCFSSLIDVNDYTVIEYEHFSVQTAPRRERARRGEARQLETRGEVEDGFYAFLWPNFTINIYPGPGNVSLNRFLPLDAGHTRAVFDYCFADGVSDGEVEEFDRFIDQVQREDTVLCESVQRGLGSGFFRQGKLVLSRESGLRHFQRLVCDSIALYVHLPHNEP